MPMQPTLRPRRSVLFMPGANARAMQKAMELPADGLIFDLEDAVSAGRKDAARASLQDFALYLAPSGADLLVRVNNHPNLLEPDIAALPAETQAIVLPKAETLDDLLAVDGLLSAREAKLGKPHGAMGVVAIIESPAAIFNLHAIAGSPRLIGLALGSEDFAAAMGTAPTPEMLALPAQLVCLAAAACGVMALAVPFSIAAFRDEIGWLRAAETAKALGATGGLCIHPSQVSAINLAFAPTAAELSWAKGVLEAWASAETSGQGVSTHDGHMIDQPVVERARALLSRHPAPAASPTGRFHPQLHAGSS